jgi:serine/threonine protein kinase
LKEKDSLKIILSVLQILVRLHDAGVSHLAINSKHILYHEQSQTIQLIDFSRSSKRSHAHPMDFQDWEGELAYIAPEQTGRLNQKIGQRADLYSIGILLYEMLAGHSPFQEENPARLVHQHLVKIPLPLHEENQEISQVLSLIVSKLLNKNPEDRYQTAFGLKKDLETYSHNSENKKTTGSFTVGMYDQSSVLHLSEKIYGREDELAQLSASVDAICEGENQLCFLSGKAGMGKTSLVYELKKNILEKNGILISGTFDQLEQNIPHQAMTAALTALANHILSESDVKLQEWQQVIKKAVGDIGQVLLDLVPKF